MSLVYYQLCRDTGRFIKKQEQPGKTQKKVFLKKMTFKKTARRQETTYVGVSFCPLTLRWRSYITINGKCMSLGNYETDKLAVIARDKVAIKHGKKTQILTNVSANAVHARK